MATTGPSWDDTEFTGDAQSDGFLPSEAAGRRRVQPETHTDAPSEASKRRGILAWIAGLSLIALIGAIGGSVLYFRNQPSVEDLAFRPQDTYSDLQPQTSPSALGTNVIDSLADSNTNRDGLMPEADTGQQVRHDGIALATLYGDSLPSAPQQKPKTEIRKAEHRTTRAVSPESTQSVGEGLYVVQVFSSPSRMDADQWVQRLQEKNISDVYITEQQIKGESWYRVRFGRFASRVEAEAEAIRRGFRQPWIARIR